MNKEVREWPAGEGMSVAAFVCQLLRALDPWELMEVGVEVFVSLVNSVAETPAESKKAINDRAEAIERLVGLLNDNPVENMTAFIVMGSWIKSLQENFREFNEKEDGKEADAF